MSNLETTKRERLEVHSSAAPDILLLDKSPKKPKTFKVDSASSVLSRVSSFLPQLRAANEELFSKLDSGTVTQSDIDLEAVEDNSEQYIEMELGVGVFDVAKERSEESQESDDDDEKKDNVLESALRIASEKKDVKTGQTSTSQEQKKPLIEEVQQGDKPDQSKLL